MFSKSFLAISVAASTFLFGSANAFSGDATWFHPGLGACGVVNTDNDLVVALSPNQWANRGHCGQRVNVQYQGRSVTAVVADLCPGCAGDGIDLSPNAFDNLASLDIGRIQVTWNFA